MKTKTTIGEFIKNLERFGKDSILIIANDVDYPDSRAENPILSRMFIDGKDSIHKEPEPNMTEVILIDFWRNFNS